MSTSRAIVSVSVLGLVLSLVTSAQAVMLVNTTTSTVLFDDNLEGAGRVGNAVAAGDPATGTYANNIGSLSIEDAASGGYAAHQGSQYLRAEGFGAPLVDRPFFDFPDQTTLGDVLELSFAVRDVNGLITLHFRLPAGGYAFNLGFAHNSGNGAFPDGMIYTNMSDNYTWSSTRDNDSWTEIVLRHAIGSTDISVSIDGGAFDTHTFAASGTTDGIGAIAITPDISPPSGNTLINLDAIPEPASLGLLALGGLVMIRRR